MKSWVWVLFFSLAACGESRGLPEVSREGASRDVIVCPAVAMTSAITIRADSPSELPAMIGVSVNGSAVASSDCDLESDPFAPISIQKKSARELSISVLIDGDSAYLPASAAGPKKSDVSLKIYGRASCADAYMLFADKPNLPITWRTQMPFGGECGVYGWLGSL